MTTLIDRPSQATLGVTPTRKAQMVQAPAGFTPVKLPNDADCGDPVMALPGTPSLSTFGSPFSSFTMLEVKHCCTLVV